MTTNYGELDTLLQEKLDTDNDFQTTLMDLSDEDREVAIETKKSELFNQEVKSLKEKAEKATKAEEIANNQKIRAEKAEKALKEKGEVPTRSSDELTLTAKDALVLSSAGVNPDDIDEIVEHAKFKKLSIADALNSSYIKSFRSEQDEFRKSKAATQVRGGPQGVKKNAGEDILNRAEKTGEFPQTEEEMQKMINAKLDRQAQSAKR